MGQCLVKLFQMFGERSVAERRAIVAQTLLHHDSVRAEHLLTVLDRLERFMRIQARLESCVCVCGCVVDHDASTTMLGLFRLLSKRVEEASFGIAHAVVDRHLLTWEQLFLLEISNLRINGSLDTAWCCLVALLGMLACGRIHDCQSLMKCLLEDMRIS